MLSLLGCLALAGCGERTERFEGPTMGSRYSVQYLREAGAPAPEQARQATEAILAEIDQQFSTYRADSEVSRFNALPAGRCMALPAPMLELVGFGERLSAESDGAFDLTLELLLDLWGFGPQARSQRVPSEAELAAALARTGHRHLAVRDGQLCKDVDLKLDFNAIAAGYAVDRVSARLAELGVRSSLVEITGEMKARGRKADGSPWRVAIEAPRDDEQQAQRIVALQDMAISTSGDYRNYFLEGGRRYSHTLDPHSGAPIAHDLAAVTVLDPSALRADGLSTLLLVLGPQAGPAFAEARGVAAFFVSRQGQGFVIHTSSRFRELVGADG
ncbi:FAD:protein FMN transferase [Pseudomonas sp. PDM13]|uniref:FAD:protein FMN transferase n=1 Tax=Pseudomonas sp. PDM13 TaxID=2769255 RepID=UPI0021DFD26C|nr:FAD:protein FMN transferase [Pseudomonas sp. PDM13]MCU9950030.1 FAD:protein FMN transferase [Pseudomonas sp. PDM13]